MSEPVRAKGISRNWIIGGVIAALILVAVLVGISMSGGDKGGGDLVGIGDVTTMLEGIPSEGATLGKPDAPVTIIEFVEPHCPNCKAASTSVIPDLVTRYVKTGEAKLQLSPIVFIDPKENSTRGAKAIFAAGEQGKAWQFAEALYRNQGTEGTPWLTEAFVKDLGNALKLDMAKFDAARGSDAAAKALEASEKLAKDNKVGGTPSFLVRDSKGTKQVTLSDFSPAGFDQAVAAVKQQ